jgi:hypothetical protein
MNTDNCKISIVPSQSIFPKKIKIMKSDFLRLYINHHIAALVHISSMVRSIIVNKALAGVTP